MVRTGHQAYKQNAGNAVISKEQILLKLYTGALDFLRLAKRGMEEENHKIKAENISKILAIITELDCALDHEAGGSIAENLSTLYQHVIFSLIQANLKNDIHALNDVERVITTIKEGFEEAIKINRQEKSSVPEAEPRHAEYKGGMCVAI